MKNRQANQNSQVAPTAPVRANVNVSYGVHNLDIAVSGMNVADVRKQLAQALNIDPLAVAIVNGNEVDLKGEVRVDLKEGDTLEFVRHAGQKGK